MDIKLKTKAMPRMDSQHGGDAEDGFQNNQNNQKGKGKGGKRVEKGVKK